MNHDKFFEEVRNAVMIINQVIAGTGNYEVEEFHEYTKDNLLAHPFDQTPASESINLDANSEDDCGRAKAMLAIIEIRRYIDGLIHDDCDVGIDEMREEFWKFVYILNMNNESMPKPEIGVDVLKDLFKEYLKTLINMDGTVSQDWIDAKKEMEAFLAWFGITHDDSYNEIRAEISDHKKEIAEREEMIHEYTNLNSEGSE